MKRLTIAAALLLGACKSTPDVPPEPVVVTQEVKVPVAVPCKALEQLGPEPKFQDNDAALKAAPDIFTRVQLLLIGRLQRTQRLAEYEVVKQACLQAK